MATLRQIEANRQNAERSTGPRTEEGKARSRRNALKHGLAGHGVVFPDETADAIAERMGLWRPRFQPDSPADEWLFIRVCTESVKVDACLHEEIALRDDCAQRAAETWDQDRALDAALLLKKLAGSPEIVQQQLLQSRQGCNALIDVWRWVEADRRQQGAWTAPAWSRALDLLGLPVEGRDQLQPTDEEGPDWIARQVEELERLRSEVLDARDDRERADAEAGIFRAEPRELKRVRRYEVAAMRRLQWAWKQLQTSPKATIEPRPLAPEPEPAPKPAPKPVAPPDSELSDADKQFVAEVLKAYPPGSLDSFEFKPLELPMKRPPAPADQRPSRKARRALARRA